MRPTRKALATLALGLALATAATAAGATLPTGTPDQADQVARKAMYQSELERNLQLRTQAGDGVAVGQRLAAPRQALYQSELERTLARHRALGAIAAQPATRPDPAPNPGVDVPATLLVGLVGGLLGGAVAMVGWTATTRRRRPGTAAGTSSH